MLPARQWAQQVERAERERQRVKEGRRERGTDKRGSSPQGRGNSLSPTVKEKRKRGE